VTRWRIILLVGLVGAAIVFGARLLSAEDKSAVGYGEDSANDRSRIVDADSHGATVQSATKTWGVDRSGAIAWSTKEGDFRPLYAVCAPVCPAAVLSSDRDGDNSIVPDPAPRLQGRAQLPNPVSFQPRRRVPCS
jgi:hypothetical protein